MSVASIVFHVFRKLRRSRPLVLLLIFICSIALFVRTRTSSLSPASVKSVLLGESRNQYFTHAKDFRAELPEVLITDLQVKFCWRYQACQIDGYLRVPKDLYLEKSWTSQAYIFIKQVPPENLKSLDDPVVLDIHVGFSSPQSNEDKNLQGDSSDVEQTQVDSKGNWVSRSHNIWLKFGKPTDFAVSGVEVLFGSDAVDPRFGWSLKGDARNAIDVGSLFHPRLTIRLGSAQKLPSTQLRMNTHGKFKIIQVADLHFSTGVGECVDAWPPETAQDCRADPQTIAFINRVLDDEKPDFAVLTGDQVFGDAAPDAQSAFLKSVAPFIDRKIPFAVTFGNHDDEGDLSRENLMAIATSLPYSLARSGPEFAKGVGNYVLSVLAPRNDHTAMTLYFLDTHKYSPNPKKFPGYNWLDPSQLDFMAASYQQLAPLRKQYSHVHMSMAFFHIPLTEYRNQSNPIVGGYREPSTAPKFNTGARSLLSELGVSVVSTGHDHVNDFCMYDTSYSPSNVPSSPASENHAKVQRQGFEPAIWLCHGGAAGLGGYAGYGGYVRRVRLFEIDSHGGQISSWKRLGFGEVDKKIDHQILVHGGKIKPLH
ncbi:Metallo-dependent phosphatase-like protein [Lipomyces japonicus]|uniref:Metallo-dependent phosphatase-like protein n=1 Tax=Lipomyces japonicus TaxID=56871 RepID=UPI0034CEF738